MHIRTPKCALVCVLVTLQLFDYRQRADPKLSVSWARALSLYDRPMLGMVIVGNRKWLDRYSLTLCFLLL